MLRSPQALVDPGSFRDPSGYIFHYGDRVFRALSDRGLAAFKPVLDSGLLATWQARGDSVSTKVVDAGELPPEALASLPSIPAAILEHARLGYISYPYEWPFALLQSAALLHLDLQLEALEAGFHFSDSSGYNVQFVGTKPVLMDVLSLRPYVEGEYWFGYRQFCEQFLNPLLLTSELGVPFGPWYRGNIGGVSVSDIAALMPFGANLSFNKLMHVTLHARLMNAAGRLDAPAASSRKISKTGLRALIAGMRKWVAKLKPKGFDETFWSDYEKRNSYAPNETRLKREFVGAYVADTRPGLLFDLGCNSGDYSELALQKGATSVIGFDFDQGALSAAVSRSKSKSLALLPLHLDITSPSPSQGWRQAERLGFQDRCKADGMIALALIHHLAIGGNIPLDQVVDWLVGVAPTGVIEFVPKSDPMVVGMLSGREDIFPNYNIEGFRSALLARAAVVGEAPLGDGGRTLFRFRTAA